MSNIKKLFNPRTDSYLKFKQKVLSNKFPWFFSERSDREDVCNDMGDEYEYTSFYSHALLLRPECLDAFLGKKYPQISSDYFEFAYNVMVEILAFNEIRVNTFLRMNVNAVHPRKNRKTTPPHLDHETIPHKNILVYLTNSGGETIHIDDNGKKEIFLPEEDDVITFSGFHCHNTPPLNRRVVLVGTYI
jgi:hypothetical protein